MSGDRAERSWAWASALIPIALFAYFGVTEWQEERGETQVRIECIKAGGTVGTKMGSPTCDVP